MAQRDVLLVTAGGSYHLLMRSLYGGNRMETIRLNSLGLDLDIESVVDITLEGSATVSVAACELEPLPNPSFPLTHDGDG